MCLLQQPSVLLLLVHQPCCHKRVPASAHNYTASYRAVDGTEDLAVEETRPKVGKIHVAAQRAFLAFYSSLAKSKKANDVRQIKNDIRKELKVGYEMAADHMIRMIV